MGAERPRVLLIDDERLARQIYSDYLVEAGCEVETAENAQVARALFTPGRYRLVVTDLLLPDSDGLELLADFKRQDPEADVIVITGHEKVEPAVRALRLGASDYLIKPVTQETLSIAVGRALGMRRVLQENFALKTSLVLFEAAGRMSAATDRGAVAEALMPALLGELKGRAGAFFCASPAGLELVRSEGLAMDEETVLVDTLVTGPFVELSRDGAEVQASLPGLAEVPSLANLYATLLPLRTEHALFGAAAIFSETMPPPASVRGVEFLARSGAVALATLDRFAKAEELSYLDDHTRLYNARYLRQALESECSGQGEGPFSLLFADLDHFKEVNDSFGHLIGSRLLQELARVIKGCVRERDVATRYGGDEFCILLKRADKATAVHIAERIRAAVAEHVFLSREGRNVQVTASIGIACYPEHARDATTLLELADQAMYRAKRTTRNTIYLATSQAA